MNTEAETIVMGKFALGGPAGWSNYLFPDSKGREELKRVIKGRFLRQ